MATSRRAEAFAQPLTLSCRPQRRVGTCTLQPRDQHVLTTLRTTAKSNVVMRDQLDSQGRRYIRLEQFLKLQGMAETGGQAKMLIHEGLVSVNGQTEVRRGRKLVQDDAVRVQGDDMQLLVHFE